MQLLQVGFEDLKTVTRLSGYHSNLLLTSTLVSPDDVMGRRLYRHLPLKAVRPNLDRLDARLGFYFYFAGFLQRGVCVAFEDTVPQAQTGASLSA